MEPVSEKELDPTRAFFIKTIEQDFSTDIFHLQSQCSNSSRFNQTYKKEHNQCKMLSVVYEKELQLLY
ncbi:hypothetical protein BpHYR1_034343 [Brachionus plicatilis]|uniref:Uncharacterized protein n=1 Tax=Brachionus plicatilis TaxID=10195 RepID=A0A3M7P8J8_BRAPC|nr:hypothetical protein BpHYR1_034343 [Brachionus plicatilis]